MEGLLGDEEEEGVQLEPPERNSVLPTDLDLAPRGSISDFCLLELCAASWFVVISGSSNRNYYL